jgi:hypothetical protein
MLRKCIVKAEHGVDRNPTQSFVKGGHVHVCSILPSGLRCRYISMGSVQGELTCGSSVVRQVEVHMSPAWDKKTPERLNCEMESFK